MFVSTADTLARPRDGPGEGGKPVVIPKENQEKMKEMFKINQFNLMASEMIALNRSLPDVRLEGWASSLQLISCPVTYATHNFLLKMAVNEIHCWDSPHRWSNLNHEPDI